MKPLVTGLIFVPAWLAAQPLRGIVRGVDGTPVVGANVFVLETLDGALADSAGRFAFAATVPRPLTLLVKRVGFAEHRRTVTAADTGTMAIVLERVAAALTPITVQAGAWTAGEQRGATLTPLEVVTTPGTAADINRTIQLLPGVAAVDDGTALFVRGGDYTETRVFMNDVGLLNPAQFLTPTGTFVGTVDPFQLDGIYFSSGGFGARYGNALSGVVGLRTRGAATRSSGTAGLGLAASSLDVAIRLSPRWTLRAAGNRTDLDPFFQVNRNARGFDPAPQGHDVSTGVTWGYRGSGELKAFVLDQSSAVGVPVDDPSYAGDFDSRVASRLMVLSWTEVLGRWGWSSSVGEASLDRRESYGAFRLDADQRQRQLFAQATRELAGGAVMRVGGEMEHLRSSIGGSLAPSGAPGDTAGARWYQFARPAQRTGAFVEVEWQLHDRLKVVPGLRTDRSILTGVRTLDPRTSVALRIADGIIATAAWGLYHQVADPLFHDDAFGRARLEPMRSSQSVFGLQVGSGTTVARAEVYDKRYRDLAFMDRDYRVFAPGDGSSRGMDLFFRSSLPGGITTRTTLTWLRARRTDPATAMLANAAFDVRWSSAVIAEKAFANGMRLGANWRSSAGRPFTPVTGATYEAASGRFIPEHGVAYSQRFPGIRRLDLSASRYRPITPHLQSVLYLSVSNVFDAANVQGWRYSRDYRERRPVPSIFNRSVYLGASLTRQ